MDETKQNVRELRELIKNTFAKRMLKYGFDRHSGGTFYRKTSFGRLGITLFYGNYGDSVKVEASATIKVDEVERLLFEFRTTAEIRPFVPKKPNEFTVCKNLGNIKIGIWRQWFVYKKSDVEEVLDEIETLVSQVGIPFLERFGEPQRLMEEIIGSTKRHSDLGRPVFWFETLFALSLALNRRDVFDEMRPVFEDILRDHRQYRFERVTRYLDWIASRFSEST